MRVVDLELREVLLARLIVWPVDIRDRDERVITQRGKRDNARHERRDGEKHYVGEPSALTVASDRRPLR